MQAWLTPGFSTIILQVRKLSRRDALLIVTSQIFTAGGARPGCQPRSPNLLGWNEREYTMFIALGYCLKSWHVYSHIKDKANSNQGFNLEIFQCHSCNAQINKGLWNGPWEETLTHITCRHHCPLRTSLFHVDFHPAPFIFQTCPLWVDGNCSRLS